MQRRSLDWAGSTDSLLIESRCAFAGHDDVIYGRAHKSAGCGSRRVAFNVIELVVDPHECRQLRSVFRTRSNGPSTMYGDTAPGRCAAAAAKPPLRFASSSGKQAYLLSGTPYFFLKRAMISAHADTCARNFLSRLRILRDISFCSMRAAS